MFRIYFSPLIWIFIQEALQGLWGCAGFVGMGIFWGLKSLPTWLLEEFIMDSITSIVN